MNKQDETTKRHREEEEEEEEEEQKEEEEEEEYCLSEAMGIVIWSLRQQRGKEIEKKEEEEGEEKCIGFGAQETTSDNCYRLHLRWYETCLVFGPPCEHQMLVTGKGTKIIVAIFSPIGGGGGGGGVDPNFHTVSCNWFTSSSPHDSNWEEVTFDCRIFMPDKRNLYLCLDNPCTLDVEAEKDFLKFVDFCHQNQNEIEKHFSIEKPPMRS